MASEILIENGEEVKVGTVRMRNSTGNAIKVQVGDDKVTLNVIQCCIGENAMEH